MSDQEKMMEAILKEMMSEYTAQDITAFEEKFQKQSGTHFRVSKKFKKRINRLFREQLGIKCIPHPEVDNAFERTRSCLIHRLHVLRGSMRKR